MADASFNDIPAGKAKRVPVNDRFTILKNSVNNIAASQLDSNSVTADKHADLSGTTDTKHSAASVKVVDASSLFTGTNAESVLTEIGQFAGMGVSGIIGQYLIGQARDDTNTFPTNSVDAAVSVPANSAPYGIVVQIDAYIVHDGTAAGNELVIPLNITNAGLNPGDLSSSGTRNKRFELGFGADGPAHVSASRIMTYLKAGDGWEDTIANTVKIGTPWTTGNMTSQNHGIIVWGLKQ